MWFITWCLNMVWENRSGCRRGHYMMNFSLFGIAVGVVGFCLVSSQPHRRAKIGQWAVPWLFRFCWCVGPWTRNKSECPRRLLLVSDWDIPGNLWARRPLVSPHCTQWKCVLLSPSECSVGRLLDLSIVFAIFYLYLLYGSYKVNMARLDYGSSLMQSGQVQLNFHHITVMNNYSHAEQVMSKSAMASS